MDIVALQAKYSNELTYIQSVLSSMNITLNSNVLVVEIDNAYTAIRNYLRLETDDDLSVYFNAAVKLATNLYNNYLVNLNVTSGNRTVTQMSQGSRSITYGSAKIELDNYGLSADVKALLPLPTLILY